MEKYSIVIPVYGQWDLFKRNIDSLLQYEGNNLVEIIAVDDCSPEQNPYTFSDPRVKIIKNQINLGYAGTVNNGLRLTISSNILLLDSDAFLIQPVLNNLNDIFNLDPMVGCIGLTSLGSSGQITGSAQFEPTVAGYILGQAVEAKWERLLKFKHKKILPFSCCVAFKKQCLEEVNFFDDETFPQVESDVDLGLRIHSSSWKVVSAKKIFVNHQGGNSYKINSKRVRLYHHAKWNLFRKHNKIRFPFLIKLLLRLRINLEIVLMRATLKIESNNLIIQEKLAGRREILKDIVHYN